MNFATVLAKYRYSFMKICKRGADDENDINYIGHNGDISNGGKDNQKNEDKDT